MPLQDLDPNGTGKYSRASSLTSKVSRDGLCHGTSVHPVDQAGVMSMLRTTTELGDLGFFAPPSRFPRPPKGNVRQLPLQLTLAPSRASSRYSKPGSSHSRSASLRSKTSTHSIGDKSIPGAWPPYSHYRPFRSDSQADSRPAAAQDSVRALTSDIRERLEASECRSQSLTSGTYHHPSGSLTNHRSVSSLKSNGPLGRPCSPFGYPARLRKPGSSRPASPALSDTIQMVGARRHRRPALGSRSNTNAPSGSWQMQPDRQWPPNRQVYDHLQRVDRLREEPRRPFVGMSPSVASYPPEYPVPRRDVHAFDRTHQLEQDLQPSLRPAQPANPVPYLGFVQRVKDALEDRISSEDQYRKGKDVSNEIDGSVEPKGETLNPGIPLTPTAPRLTKDMVQIATAPTPTTHGEESELDTTESSTKRLTRDLIRSQLYIDEVSDRGSSFENGSARSPFRPNPSQKSDQNDSPAKPQRTFDLISARPEDATIYKDHSLNKMSSSVQRNHGISMNNEAVAPHDTLESSNSQKSEETLQEVTSSAMAPDKNSDTVDERPSSPKRIPSVVKPAPPKASNARPASTPQEHCKESVQGHRNVSQTQSLPVQNDIKLRASNASSLFNINCSPDIGESKHSEQLTEEDISTGLIDKSRAIPGSPKNQDDTLSSVDATGSSIGQPGPSIVSGRSSQSEPVKSVSTTPPKLLTSARLPSLPDFRSSMLSALSAAINNASESFSTSDVDQASKFSQIGRVGAPSALPSALKEIRNTSFVRGAPLPDLTEDSQEDASTTNLRMLGARGPAFRAGAFKALREARQAHRASSQPIPFEKPRTYFNRDGSEAHEIPTLNFSRIDLTTKLNRALGIRSSRSEDDLASLRESTSTTIGLNRPASVDLISCTRDRYRSYFFAKEDSDDEQNGSIQFNEMAPANDQGLTHQRKVTLIDDELLTEIDRVSIPSVNNLTVRLSELLPALRAQDLETYILEHNIETAEAAKIADEQRKETDADDHHTLEKDVACVSTPPCHSNPRQQLLNKALPPLPHTDENIDADGHETKARMAASNHALQDMITASGKTAAVADPLEDSGASEGNDGELSAMTEPRQATTDTSRPWNKDENYPWRGRSPPLRVAVGSRPDGRSVTPATSNRTRLYESQSTSSQDPINRVARSMSPGFDATLVPDANVSRGAIEQIESTINARGIIGSVARRMGISRKKGGQAGFQLDPFFMHPETERNIGPGDRYPTSALQRPTGQSIENRSYFSDDSSIAERPTTFRKRITRVRPFKRSTTARGVTPGYDSTSEIRPATPGMTNDGSTFSVHSMQGESPPAFNFDERMPKGMSKAEFHAKRLVEKIRSLWMRGGNVFRTKSNKDKGQVHIQHSNVSEVA